MLKIAFLCSGGGGNLRFIAKVISLGWISNVKISGVITDRKCLANKFAKENNIYTSVVNFSEKNQLNLINELNRLDVDIIISTVNKILLPVVVDAFKGSLINLHYSLLPAFGGSIGTTPVKFALTYGAQFVGTTVHLIDTLVDSGTPLVQAVIPVKAGDNVGSLIDIVFRCGCITLLNCIQILRPEVRQPAHVYRSLLTISGRIIVINPMFIYYSSQEDEKFWLQFKSYPLDEVEK